MGADAGRCWTSWRSASLRFDCDRAREILMRAVAEYQPSGQGSGSCLAPRWVARQRRAVADDEKVRESYVPRRRPDTVSFLISHIRSGPPCKANSLEFRPLRPSRALSGNFMRVTIFGSGYVGLVTGACLADAGNDVLCVDVDAKKIEGLKRGEIPIHEPGLDALIKTQCRSRTPDVHDLGGRGRGPWPVPAHRGRHAARRRRLRRSQVRAGRRAHRSAST